MLSCYNRPDPPDVRNSSARPKLTENQNTPTRNFKVTPGKRAPGANHACIAAKLELVFLKKNRKIRGAVVPKKRPVEGSFLYVRVSKI